ncbi:MAG: hypothetical protein ACI4M9_02945 [Succinivibrio sp.]
MNIKAIYKKTLKAFVIGFTLIDAIFICILSVNIPYSSQQKYIDDYLIETSFNCTNSKLYFLPVTAVFENENGKKYSKNLLEKKELFCISIEPQAITNTIPLRNDFKKLVLEFSFSHGQLSLSDLRIGN